MEKHIIAAELKKSADEIGLVTVLSQFAPNIHVKIPMTQSLWDTPVEEIPFSVRSRNGIMRTGARTIGDVSQMIMSERGLDSVRNLGRKSISEIKTAILQLAYNKLSEREKDEFWLYVVENNGGHDHAVR